MLPQMTHATKNAEVKIETLSCSPGSWMLIFHFPEPVEFKNEIEEGQLYLEFNQAIDSKDFLTAQDKISTLIKRVSNGYHTLLFEARRPLIYQMESSGSVFYLHLIPDLNAPLEMTKQSKVAFARLLIEKRAYQAAFQQLKRLMQEYPDDKDLWILYSTLEGLLPKWIKQVEILRELHLKNPLDEDIETLMYEAFSPHSSYVLAQRQMQRTISIAAVQVYLLEGEKMIHCFPDHVTYFGSQYQVWDGHVSSIVNSSGQAVGFKQWRNRGAFYLRNDWRNGDSLKLSFYGQEGALGAGLEYKTLIPFLQGSIFTDLQWHRPSWEVFEALAFSGREDRLFLRSNQCITGISPGVLEEEREGLGLAGPLMDLLLHWPMQVFISI
ncbi:MAG: hypothetical protein HWD61_01785 [Parachlamydiaceae bacterium]|nr:MAG: hypothetical protein HWD61_01785 [Parachlamydiaceae bacterium]